MPCDRPWRAVMGQVHSRFSTSPSNKGRFNGLGAKPPCFGWRPWGLQVGSRMRIGSHGFCCSRVSRKHSEESLSVGYRHLTSDMAADLVTLVGERVSNMILTSSWTVRVSWLALGVLVGCETD